MMNHDLTTHREIIFMNMNILNTTKARFYKSTWILQINL